MGTIFHKKEYTAFSVFVCVVCFFTNLSQMPFLVESALTRYVSIPIWLVLGFICLIKEKNIQFKRIIGVLGIAVLFLLYYLVFRVVNPAVGRSALPYPIFLSLFVLLIGTMAGRYLTKYDIDRVITVYIIGGIIVSVNIYFSYLAGGDLASESYLYASKNSVAQILLTTWILILLRKFNIESVPKKIFYIVAFIFVTWTMIGLKSRSTLIGMPIALIWLLAHGNVKKSVRNTVILILSVFVILMFNDEFYDFMVNNIMFAGRDADDISRVTSGRSDEWASFLTDFTDNNWLFGQGRQKRESMILTSLLEYGMIGGPLIITLGLSPLYYSVATLKKEQPYFLLFSTIALVYFANGIFEQLAPFGPGVKCYFLWFMFGILTTDRHFYLRKKEVTQ